MKKAKKQRPKSSTALSIASKKSRGKAAKYPNPDMNSGLRKGYSFLVIYTIKIEAVKRKAKRKIKEQDRAIEKVVWKSIEVMLISFITYLLSKILS